MITRSILSSRLNYLFGFMPIQQTNYCSSKYDPDVKSKFIDSLDLIRFFKPAGTFLTYLPSAWAICLAAPPGSLPDALILSKFLAGAFCARSAGCIINDLWDQDLDRRVERTKNRPLANHRISSKLAIAQCIFWFTGGFAILLSLNNLSICMGFLAVPLIVLYPKMKQITFWPQLFLGVIFNWGVILAFAQLSQTLSIATALPLYLSSILWTLYYDTIYAYQDMRDDKKVGVKSSAIAIGEKYHKYILSIFMIGMFSFLLISGYVNNLNFPIFVSSVVLSILKTTSDIKKLKFENFAACGKIFQNNVYMGFIILLGIIFAKWFHHSQAEETVNVDEL